MKNKYMNKYSSMKNYNDMNLDACLVRNALLILRFAIIRLTLFSFIVVFLLFLDLELFCYVFFNDLFRVCFGHTFSCKLINPSPSHPSFPPFLPSTPLIQTPPLDMRQVLRLTPRPLHTRQIRYQITLHKNP